MTEALITSEPSGQTAEPSVSTTAAAVATDAVEHAVTRGAQWLLSSQNQEGYWWGELEADTTLESDYILYLHILGQAASPKIPKLARYIRDRQLADGGWNIFQGGPAELNATIKAWLALRLAGDSAAAPHLQRARQRVHELGGLEASNSYVRFYCAMSGLITWSYAPAIPPELILLPNWFPVNLYEMSSWTRGIVVPLTLIYARKPSWKMPRDVRVDELFARPGARPPSLSWDRSVFSWKNFFLIVDRALKLYESSPWKPFRKAALWRARTWMLERLERSEGLGTIYPAMMNSIFALLADAEPTDDSHDPVLEREIKFLERYEIEDQDSIRVQPCISPVWDTAIATVSLEEAGLDPSHPALVRAGRWLLANQILGPGDWQVKNQKAEPGGWAFEFRNDFYPDVDDTAFVLMALSRVVIPETDQLRAAIRRGLAWLLSMQNSDGGWGAFDHENNLQFLNHIPFADHNAMLDPSTADVTARAIECLGHMGWSPDHPALQRACAFLTKDQTSDGSWFGRWGVNYIYGTSGVLRSLEAIGRSGDADGRRAAEWLRGVQNLDGGYGESILSYYDPALKAKGQSTASQTAWGLIGLLAVVGPEDPAVECAVSWLVSHQSEDGSWDEAEFTGTGFPQVFYLKYHLYRNCFPVYALARYDNLRKNRERFISVQVPSSEVERPDGRWR